MSETSIIKIRVGAEAKRVIEKTASDLDMKEIGVASRIYAWFSRQPDVVRKGVLGLLPEGMEADVARMALERMAGDAAGGKRKR